MSHLLENSRLYQSPHIEELDISLSAIICTSPEEGGSEDVGYEDWIL